MIRKDKKPRKKEKKMKLLINNTTDQDIDFDKDLEKTAREVLKVEGIDSRVEISLSFVDRDEIHRMNKEYRQVDRPTDVLSFPIYETKDDLIKEQEDSQGVFEPTLGDIVICMDVAKEQAKDFGHSLERELMYLSCHSILHLLGYDHMTEEDKKVMRSREKTIMKNLGVFKNG